MRDKPVKWRLKIWKLCDDTSYLYAFHVYQEKENTEKSQHGLGYDVVKKLVGYLPEKHPHHLFVNNYYTSMFLAEDLLKDYISITSTCKANYRNFSKKVSKMKVQEQGDMVWCMKQPGILALKWLDTAEVYMISTAHISTCSLKTKRQKVPGGYIERNCPEAISDYCNGMGAVDRHNQAISFYTIDRR